MTKERFLSILRILLTLAGSFIVFNDTFNNQLWSIISGLLMTGASVVWAIFDKTVTEEMWQTFLRQVLVFIAGFLLAKGILNDQAYQEVLALILVLLPAAQGSLSTNKSRRLASGKITIEQLKK